MTVAGVDGCKGGWLVVFEDDGELDANFIPSVEPLLVDLRQGRLDAVAIDMPIGLLDAPRRQCDVEARRLLGPRRSTIFPAPTRASLKATDYERACELSRASAGVALSRQTFNLLPKIKELDELIVPVDQPRLTEAHPECAFTRLAGHPPPDSKRTAQGRAWRTQLLGQALPHFPGLVETSQDLPQLDLIDAAALAITARRMAEGTQRQLGHEVDATGLTASIAY